MFLVHSNIVAVPAVQNSNRIISIMPVSPKWFETVVSRLP